MTWVAIVERQRSGCSRNQDKVYEHVISSVRQLKVDAGTYVSQNPSHPWADPLFREFIVDIPDQTAADIQNGTTPLFYDRFGNEPRWQQETDGSGSTFAPGSFSDPLDHNSAFAASTPLPDDRWIVRLYDGDPLAAGQHIAALGLDEGQEQGPVPDQYEVHMRLFNADDTPSGTNAQNAKTQIADKLFIFDFANGVTTFGIVTTAAGQILFPSGREYRVLGPAGEKEVTFTIYGRSLSV